MNWETLYQMQRNLDQYIENQHQIEQGTKVDEKILAFLVEVGELANETRCFKFWSLKGPSDKDVILEEYVDGLHFLLSVGLDCGFRYTETEYGECDTQVEAFLNIYRSSETFRDKKTAANYQQLFSSFLQLGRTLGFHEDESFHAYYEKNEVNYQRQDEGY
ncbi:dUTP diphosphatase [Halobacillus yeomjeoni]|uniref:dUTP diphosphatase n=1 Tax=Halobacillus yeomjeoni TaxID=311194 RepID=A0A931HVG4_9BACI|nr:dUTP diphosphatase [Halobacillus yeomjeoni]MBH0230103.1 dUTP diphosphatase [Halobacillus yeomjeoni]